MASPRSSQQEAEKREEAQKAFEKKAEICFAELMQKIRLYHAHKAKDDASAMHLAEGSITSFLNKESNQEILRKLFARSPLPNYIKPKDLRDFYGCIMPLAELNSAKTELMRPLWYPIVFDVMGQPSFAERLLEATKEKNNIKMINAILGNQKVGELRHLKESLLNHVSENRKNKQELYDHAKAVMQSSLIAFETGIEIGKNKKSKNVEKQEMYNRNMNMSLSRSPNQYEIKLFDDFAKDADMIEARYAVLIAAIFRHKNPPDFLDIDKILSYAKASPSNFLGILISPRKLLKLSDAGELTTVSESIDLSGLLFSEQSKFGVYRAYTAITNFLNSINLEATNDVLQNPSKDDKTVFSRISSFINKKTDTSVNVGQDALPALGVVLAAELIVHGKDFTQYNLHAVKEGVKQAETFFLNNIHKAEHWNNNMVSVFLKLCIEPSNDSYPREITPQVLLKIISSQKDTKLLDLLINDARTQKRLLQLASIDKKPSDILQGLKTHIAHFKRGHSELYDQWQNKIAEIEAALVTRVADLKDEAEMRKRLKEEELELMTAAIQPVSSSTKILASIHPDEKKSALHAKLQAALAKAKEKGSTLQEPNPTPVIATTETAPLPSLDKNTSQIEEDKRQSITVKFGRGSSSE